jgi:hypothetical protein
MTLRDHDLIFRRPPLINDHFTEQGSHLEESVDRLHIVERWAAVDARILARGRNG